MKASKRTKQVRNHRVTLLLNDSEKRALERYCQRYLIHNRSKLIREMLMASILKQFDRDNPTLFD